MNSEYLYVQIYKRLLEEIEHQNYKPGDRLPTEKELSEKYNVSRITSQKAMNMLVDEGVVIRYPGIGSFVAGGKSFDEQKGEAPLKAKGRKIIGLVMEAMWHSFGIGVFDGAYERAREMGYDLVVKKSYGNQEQEMKAIDELIEMGAEGIIIMPVHGDYYSEEILKLVVEKFPILFVDRYLNGIHVPFVGSDNVGGMKQAVEYLVKHNHKNIALITTKDHEATTLDERKQGYIEASIEHKTHIAIFDKAKCIIPDTYCPSDMNQTFEAIRGFLEENPDITAVVTTEYFLGKIVKQAAVNMGKNVPRDLSIVCFDAPHEYLGDYELTHIRQDEECVGKSAIEVLNQLVNGEEINEKILIKTSLIKGRSVGARKEGI
ncbi:MAG: GntR family transcriptional regulator [Cellulosilyticaceae bacterium]